MRRDKLKLEVITVEHSFSPFNNADGGNYTFKCGIVSGLTSDFGLFYHTVTLPGVDVGALEMIAHQKTYEVFAEKFRELFMGSV